MSKKSKSNNYKDAFRQVLKEYSRGGSYAPSGPGSINTTNSQSYGNIRKGQNPPYSTYTDIDGRSNFLVHGIRIQSKDETDAPSIAPYPLQTVTDYLVDAYEKLVDVKGHVTMSYDNPALTPGQQKELTIIDKKLETVLDYVKNLGDEILKIKLKQD